MILTSPAMSRAEVFLSIGLLLGIISWNLLRRSQLYRFWVMDKRLVSYRSEPPVSPLAYGAVTWRWFVVYPAKTCLPFRRRNHPSTHNGSRENLVGRGPGAVAHLPRSRRMARLGT
jgi:hypothetical protein